MSSQSLGLHHNIGITRSSHFIDGPPFICALASSLCLQIYHFREGADGNWSTFNLRVGNPPQIVRVLPSTAAGDTLVVGPKGCLPGEPGVGGSPLLSCWDSRGGIFNPSLSASWNTTGNYSMDVEVDLGYGDDAAAYGFDTVGIDLNNATGAPTLDEQIVGVFENNDFYLGLFGLSREPTNFTNFTTPHPSFLASLKNRSMIPSLSWGYTAGAHYQSKGGSFGSLTFGGYDSSRFITNNVTFLMAEDISRDLVVNVRSIIAEYENGTATTLLSSPSATLAFIDSTQPYMYLPEHICQNFQKSFGLTWNSSDEMYLVDDDTHNILVNANPNITFRLANAQGSEDTVDIVFPYASFDLVTEYPLLGDTVRYFPLAKGDNDTQYTLGRSFLQEAYLVTNYENSSFSIFQTNHEAGRGSNLVAITSNSDSPIKHHVGLAVKLGASLGGIAAGLLVSLAALIAFKKLRKCDMTIRQVRGTESHQRAPNTMYPADSLEPREIASNSRVGHHRELPDSGKVELLDISTPSGSGHNISELSQPSDDSLDVLQDVHELVTHHSSPRLVAVSTEKNPNANDKLAIVIATQLSQESRTGSEALPETSGVQTTIYSMRADSVDLDRSLPPTPISDSVQYSPIGTNFQEQSPVIQGVVSPLQNSIRLRPVPINMVNQGRAWSLPP